MFEKTIPFNQLGKAGYNRGIDRAHVNEIKNDFHEDMVPPTIASFRDGKYWIIDHQHVSQAQYELNDCDPNTPIKCVVYEGLTYEQEADLYYRLNTGSKPLSFKDKLIGLIESKDETAISFRDLVEQCGYTLGTHSVNTLGACSVAWNIFNGSDGYERLKRLLTLTHECWPSDKNSAHSNILKGLELFFVRHGDDFDCNHFIKVFGQLNPKEIVRKGVTFYKQMDSKTFTHPYCTYVIIVNNYNTGLRTNKIDPVTPRI